MGSQKTGSFRSTGGGKTGSLLDSHDGKTGSFRSSSDGRTYPLLTHSTASLDPKGEVVLHFTLRTTPQTEHHLRLTASPTQGISYVQPLMANFGSAFSSFPFVGATVQLERLEEKESKEGETIAQYNLTCACKTKKLVISEGVSGGAIKVTTKMRKFPACCKPDRRLLEVRVQVAGSNQLSVACDEHTPTGDELQICKEVKWRRGNGSLMEGESASTDGLSSVDMSQSGCAASTKSQGITCQH